MTTEATITTAAPGPAQAAPTTAPAVAAPPAVSAAPAVPAATAPAVVPNIDATPATPAAAPTPEPLAQVQSVAYEQTGDPGLDLALSFIGKLGIGPDHAAMQAAAAGDFAILKAHLAQMGDAAKGWEHVVAAGEQAYGRKTEASKAEAAKTQDSILTVFGLDAKNPNSRDPAAKEWGKVREWAAANAEPHEKAQVNAALAAGGIAAKAMAKYLNDLYRAHPSAVIEPVAVTQVGGRAVAGNDWALSPDQYKAEVAKLSGEKRGQIDGTPEYRVLQQRRASWRPAGR
jgi:hypothetical protein